MHLLTLPPLFVACFLACLQAPHNVRDDVSSPVQETTTPQEEGGQDEPPIQQEAPKQGKPPRAKDERFTGPGNRTEPAAPLLASDGEPVSPGRIPSDTTPESLALWQDIVAATRVNDSNPPPIDSFKLTFDVDSRHDSGKNDVTLQLTFQNQPGYLRTVMERSRRVQLRGPKGDWLVDKDETIDLTRGRENRESRRNMDQWISIARNFVTLTNPSRVRIQSLRQAEPPPTMLPTSVASDLEGLAWIEVASPDFMVVPTGSSSQPRDAQTPVYKALIGLRRATGTIDYVLLRDGNAANIRQARLMRYSKWQAVDGYRLPHNMLVYLIDDSRLGVRFLENASYDLYLHRGARLNPELEAALFEPK